MVGSGTLSIESAGDSPNELFRAIPHSDRVQQLINHLIDEDANQRAMRMVSRAQGESPETREVQPAAPSTTAEPVVRPDPSPTATRANGTVTTPRSGRDRRYAGGLRGDRGLPLRP